MAIPASYTESTLRDYMLSVTVNVAGALGWTATNFTEAVNDALVAYGVPTIVQATDVAKLRVLAKVEAWRIVVDGAAADIEFTADGANFKRNQMHQQAVAALERAQSEAVAKGYAADSAPAILLGSMSHTDPYLTDESLYDASLDSE